MVGDAKLIDFGEDTTDVFVETVNHRCVAGVLVMHARFQLLAVALDQLRLTLNRSMNGMVG